MFDLIGESLVKSVINSFLGSNSQKIKMEFEPPEGKMLIRHIEPDGSNHTYEISFEKIKEMINK